MNEVEQVSEVIEGIKSKFGGGSGDNMIFEYLSEIFNKKLMSLLLL